MLRPSMDEARRLLERGLAMDWPWASPEWKSWAEDARAFLAQPDVRCPYCKKKLAERLNGKVEFTCRGCKRKVTIKRV